MKTIIVYYSLEGNTEYAAQTIANQLDADLLRIEPAKSYPTVYQSFGEIVKQLIRLSFVLRGGSENLIMKSG